VFDAAGLWLLAEDPEDVDVELWEHALKVERGEVVEDAVVDLTNTSLGQDIDVDLLENALKTLRVSPIELACAAPAA